MFKLLNSVIWPTLTYLSRYNIDSSAPGWEEAEKQVAKALKKGEAVGTISVKSSKRKVGDTTTAEQIWKEEFGEKEPKPKKNKVDKKDKGSKKARWDMPRESQLEWVG